MGRRRITYRIDLDDGQLRRCSCNDADELGKLVHVVGSAPRSEHVVGQVMKPHAVAGIEECLQMSPRALDRARMSPIAHIKETDRLVDAWCV